MPTVPLPPADEEYIARVKASFAALRAALDALDAAAASGAPPPPPPGWQERFRGSPGVRMEDEAIGWGELCAIVADGSPRTLGTLGRTPLQVRQASGWAGCRRCCAAHTWHARGWHSIQQPLHSRPASPPQPLTN